ncbi:hypothetical protein [Roseimicrobium sp. ORNL1]|uniref:hypothetical protein n=1 Tax=Roseimicrobium sp. ORNL1 TaxID=2711231 RepID=UPI0013E1C28E|nr:hypothetical protein [Roseimicrobium sp. ORNL1]QIF04635.1 hypothetical protein G5S37_24935 [Roseimicrobium sp. ORNL1]
MSPKTPKPTYLNSHPRTPKVLGYQFTALRSEHMDALEAAKSPFLNRFSPIVQWGDVLLASKVLSCNGTISDMAATLKWTWRDRWLVLRNLWSQRAFLDSCASIFRHLEGREMK